MQYSIKGHHTDWVYHSIEGVSPFICYYCGESSDTRDHFPPISRRHDAPGVRRILVPCCRECNMLLGSSLQATLDERVQYLKARLRSRYKKDLGCPDWEDHEIRKLGKLLKSKVVTSLAKKKRVTSRIEYCGNTAPAQPGSTGRAGASQLPA